MTEPNSKPEKPKDERRYDPELLKKGLRCDIDQLEMLKRCSEKKDIIEWHEWRVRHQDEEIWLQGADLIRANLELVDLSKSHLERANLAFTNLSGAHLYEANLKGVSLAMANLQNVMLRRADLQDAFIPMANLQGTDLIEANLKKAHVAGSNLQGAVLREANLEGANFEIALVDGGTLFWKCKLNRYRKNKRFTEFAGVGLGSCRIEPEVKQLLEYNIRRKNWEEWYRKGCWWQRILKRINVWPFWLISDYGISTKRIIFTFLGLAVLFALLYRLFPGFVMVYGKVGDIRGFWHALYFSVVTMTTLGFGDIAANPDSWVGQTLLMIQVILGYVLLGALVTRFAVLFKAGGPAGKFADEKEKEDEKK
jgi:hypothetical protein